MGFDDSTAEVMVNQQLISFFGNLLFQARQSREKGNIYQYWFTMKGVKPTENSNFIVIKSAAELSQFESSSNDENDTNHTHKQAMSSTITPIKNRAKRVPPPHRIEKHLAQMKTLLLLIANRLVLVISPHSVIWKMPTNRPNK